MEAKESVVYVVPSFPVLSVSLRHVRFQVIEGDDDEEVYDGFIRQCPSLTRKAYPFIVEVETSYKNAFSLK